MALITKLDKRPIESVEFDDCGNIELMSSKLNDYIGTENAKPKLIVNDNIKADCGIQITAKTVSCEQIAKLMVATYSTFHKSFLNETLTEDEKNAKVSNITKSLKKMGIRFTDKVKSTNATFMVWFDAEDSDKPVFSELKASGHVGYLIDLYNSAGALKMVYSALS